MGVEEDDVDFANRLVSHKVVEFELSRLAEVLQKSGGELPLHLQSRQMALEMRKEIIEMQIETEQLTLEQYVQSIKEAIPKEKQRALKCRGLPGGKPKALEALKHAKIMEEELAGGEDEGGDEA